MTGFTPHYLMFGSEPFSDFDVRMPTDPAVLPLPVHEHSEKIIEHINDAHVSARQHFKAAAETRKRYYDRDIDRDGHNRRKRQYEPGERVLLKVSDHHLHLGKMNDRYDGPYFVITVFDNGVMRVKEEARPDKPPKMVHHDRVRRFEQEGPLDTPRWVHDAIAAFQRRAAAATQTGNQDGLETPNSGCDAPAAIQCVSCNQPRIDNYGLIRVFNRQRRCHLCCDVSRSNMSSDSVVDDVSDHDLYHC